MAAVESEVRQLVDDASFSAAHAATAHHLGEAQQLLSSATSTAKPVVVEIGDHLRSALQTVIHDVAGGNPERPVPNLSAWALSVAAEREPTILVDMVVHALSCSQRLTHIRDETAHARPLRSLDELRRVVFLTTVVCYEVAALPPTRDRTGDQPDPSTDPGEFTSRRGDLNDLEHGYVVASRADNTIRGYRADWAEWCDWAARNGYCPLPAARCPLPADPAGISANWRPSLRPPKVGTMNGRISSIRFAHRMRSLPDPTADAVGSSHRDRSSTLSLRSGCA